MRTPRPYDDWWHHHRLPLFHDSPSHNIRIRETRGVPQAPHLQSLQDVCQGHHAPRRCYRACGASWVTFMGYLIFGTRAARCFIMDFFRVTRVTTRTILVRLLIYLSVPRATDIKQCFIYGSCYTIKGSTRFSFGIGGLRSNERRVLFRTLICFSYMVLCYISFILDHGSRYRHVVIISGQVTRLVIFMTRFGGKTRRLFSLKGTRSL